MEIPMPDFMRLILKGLYAEMPAEEQRLVDECKGKLRDLVNLYGNKVYSMAVPFVAEEIMDIVKKERGEMGGKD